MEKNELLKNDVCLINYAYICIVKIMKNMNVKSIMDFRQDLDATLDSVSDDDDTVIINRPNNKDVVLISLKSYNSLQETLYLMSSVKNRERLDTAVNEINLGINLLKKELI
jgi:antitoxin YefM